MGRGKKRFSCAHDEAGEDSTLICTDCDTLQREALEACAEFYRLFPLGMKRMSAWGERAYAIGKRAVEEKVC